MQLSEAKAIADKIVETLSPFCDKCLIAGSIRREKPEVKDIEICCIPSIEEFYDITTGTLFSAPKKISRRNYGFVHEVNRLGIIEKGNPQEGKYCAVLLPEGIKLDLFIPDANDFYRQFAIRTGSADYSFKVIANGWKKIGWVGTENGLRKMSDCIEQKLPDGKSKWKCVNSNPELPPVWNSEEDFFEWIKVKYVSPIERNI